MATETSSAVGNGYARTLGGTVETVLSSPRIQPPPATLEEARNAPGRSERIQRIAERIEREGIRYVFFQQVSVTGRVMGKGVVSTFFPQVAEKGYQLVYGATANLFTDRYGNYIGFGPEESELAAVADLDTFEVLPWDPRVARVYCDCYDTETGELLDADPKGHPPAPREHTSLSARPARRAKNTPPPPMVAPGVGHNRVLPPPSA